MMEDKKETTIMLDPRRNQRRERKKLFEEMLLKDIPGTSRANEPMHAVLEGELAESELLEGKESQNVRNRALIHYLATLANSNNTKDTFDFDFVQSLLNNGADINSTDKTGQTVFHEVARSWNIDVATFLIRNGANVNQQDQYGRSPLHVAAAVDYAEMVEFLLENEADIDIQTSEEGQAPIHFAAKNDAINSLQMLLGYGANIDARDSKNRTPLQVAAEMNRSKAAKLLIAEGAPAGVYDNLGNSALSLLIEKIPEVALDAMDQFHSVDTINRKEFYFLNYLEGTKLKEEKTPARTPLEIAVQNERFDIIMHPVMQRLIGAKWQCYAKWGAVQDLVVNVIYTMLWTLLAVTLPKYGKDLYIPIGPNSWRLIIGIFLILLTIVEIRKQILNTIKTRQEHNAWKEWRASELERDIQYCHPRWPQEAQYVNAEIKAVRNLSLMSGSVYWIYFDWISLVLILATIVSHIVFFNSSTDLSRNVHQYITMPLLLILWLRIFKYARPFESAGPFIVIFGSVMGDFVKWGFLNLVIVIPFTCAFWITFGGISLNPVDGYDSVGPLFYNIFSMMVVSSHGFENLEKENPFMARLLCGGFIAISAIVTLNLLIALLTNTFERLYENAVANAVMQRAQTILLLQKSLRQKQKSKYYNFIKEKASPEIISKNLGRLMSTDNDEATIERVREDVKAIMNVLGEQFGKKSRKGRKSDLDFVKMDVNKVRRIQEEMAVDMRNVKLVLEEIKATCQLTTNNNMIPTPMNITASNHSNERDNDNKGENDANDGSKYDESNSEDNDDDNENNHIYKKIDDDNVKDTNGNSKYHNNDKGKKKNNNLSKNSKGNFGEKSEKLKLKTKSHNENHQMKLKENFKSDSETESSETSTDSTNEGEDKITARKVRSKSNEKKDIKNKKRGNKNGNRDKPMVRGNKDSSNESCNLGQKSPPVHSENYGEVTRKRTAYPSGFAKTSLHEVYDPYMAQDKSSYPPAQSPSSLPGLWKHTNIPYSHISQHPFPKTYDRNQLMHNQQKKDFSSPATQMQQELYPQFPYFDEKPNTVSWSNPQQNLSDSMAPQYPLGYFTATEFGRDEIPKNVRSSQSLQTNHRNSNFPEQQTSRTNPNNPQTFSDASQSSTTQYFQEPMAYATQNHGFSMDDELVNHSQYPPKDQTSTRHGTTTRNDMLALHGYPQEKYDIDQHLSSSTSQRRVTSSALRDQQAMPNTGIMRSSFTAFPKSHSTSDLLVDQNSHQAAAVNKKEKRQRSISVQPTGRELKIMPGRRQSENLNIKRPCFQIIQQEFHEPLRSLTPVKQDDENVAFSQYETSLPPSTEDLDEKETEE